MQTANGDFEEDALIEDERYVAAFVKGNSSTPAGLVSQVLLLLLLQRGSGGGVHVHAYIHITTPPLLRPHQCHRPCAYTSSKREKASASASAIPCLQPWMPSLPAATTAWLKAVRLPATEHHFAAAASITSAGKGMVVFSACSHAGIINVMTDVAAQSGQSPYAVFGGELAAVLVVPEMHSIC